MTVLTIRAHRRYAVRQPVRLVKAGAKPVSGLMIELSSEGIRISNLGRSPFAIGDLSVNLFSGTGLYYLTLVCLVLTYLGVKLLVRTTRLISLTHEGSAFLEDCQRLLSDVANAEASVSAGGVKATGHLRITAPAGSLLAPALQPAALAAAAAAARSAGQVLRACNTERVVALIDHVARRFLDPTDGLRTEALHWLPEATGYSPAMCARVLDRMAADWTARKTPAVFNAVSSSNVRGR